jgi:vacuolar-type H+-ATPase subunit F/Vma7
MSQFVFDLEKVNHDLSNSNDAVGMTEEQAEALNEKIKAVVEKSDKPSILFVNLHAELSKDELCALASQMLVDKMRVINPLETLLASLGE